MAKFYGKIGYAVTEEVYIDGHSTGVWKETITEREYYGDIIQNIRQLENHYQLNSNINIANKISIISDPFANNNFHSMRYIEYMGAKWYIQRVEVAYPRLILTIGGVYNGEST